MWPKSGLVKVFKFIAGGGVASSVSFEVGRPRLNKLGGLSSSDGFRGRRTTSGYVPPQPRGAPARTRFVVNGELQWFVRGAISVRCHRGKIDLAARPQSQVK